MPKAWFNYSLPASFQQTGHPLTKYVYILLFDPQGNNHSFSSIPTKPLIALESEHGAASAQVSPFIKPPSISNNQQQATR
jgi:hypothetical protein